MNFWKNLHPLLRQRKSAYESANYAVLHSLADSLSDAERDTIAKKVQSNFKTATGDYLDIWASWFHVLRHENESDDDFRQRIMFYLLMPRSTVQGIIQGIQYYLDDNDAKIIIYEPWKNIFKTNNSLLNGPDHLQGTYYRYGVIDVNIDRPMSQAIYDAIQAFKPAGVKFYITLNQGLEADAKALPIGGLGVKNMNEIQQMFGFSYHGSFPITFADRADTLVPITDYFKTNNSKLNGADVLAGSPLHNVTYWNSLNTSSSQYKDVPVNLALGTANSVSATGRNISNQTIPTYYFVEPLSNLVTQVGSPITLSFDYTITGSLSGTTRVQYNHTPWGGGLNTIPMVSSGHFSQTVLADSTYIGATATGFNFRLDNFSGTITISNLKLELGTSASPWSPNPADPEYYMATDEQRVILSKETYPYIALPRISGVDMLDGTLSLYNLFTNKYQGLLDTYAGSTNYEKVISMINDSNVTLSIKINTDKGVSINGNTVPSGISSISLDKSSIIKTSSDIYVPIKVSGASDTNIHYLVVYAYISKQVPGLGANIISEQMETKISN